MSRYFVARAVQTAVTLLLMSLIVYLLIGLMPGDPIDMMISGDPTMTSQDASAFDPLRRALWLDALDQRLRPTLPSSLAAHARLANLDGGRLVYVVDAPVWRAKLRLIAPELLDAARSLGLGVTELVVKTTTHPIHPPKQADPKHTYTR